MFGLKIVKSQDYADLKYQLQQALEIITEDSKKIDDLNDTIRKQNELLKKYRSESKKSSKTVKSDAILLTDVAETPLVEETNSNGKPKRVVKKTGNSKPRRRVIHKTTEK